METQEELEQKQEETKQGKEKKQGFSKKGTCEMMGVIKFKRNK